MKRHAFNAEYFASALKQAIGERSLRRAAMDLGCSVSTLSRLRRGERPDIDTFAELCGRMKREPREFFYDVEANE